MEALSHNDRKALDALIEQRRSHQISKYTFEERKRELLGEPPKKVPILLNAFLLIVIFVVILLGSMVLYPKNTFIFLDITYQIVKPRWGETSAAAIPAKFKEHKELSDEVADKLFEDPAGWKDLKNP